ncbi:hypothetical protein WKR88_01625 [Trinickia caryophylli]|uniref:Uncharacterized protein n=1 Tax=Trinickia caryophylli TaxID=28094 RepID=A0A1X7CJD0_TRICW|nr:hypothetical protein [Trinickia caryophylli]PMS11504.1 hypothetical protein C0Z17_13565 [Trinickia caryophylli]TRX19945.1 hypothetical protein FNF07_18215 [Trinickia caryophylli]WQE12718.1 hypothetical protein U0034_04740 [Trinickia caryophylli]SME97483.1 hypothetical protein SAMN06295900_101458 [Trinickia caryophylli]GLU30425.1 hypothetical protein Busp01_02670 [Trinickia caryophylli]
MLEDDDVSAPLEVEESVELVEPDNVLDEIPSLVSAASIAASSGFESEDEVEEVVVESSDDLPPDVPLLSIAHKLLSELELATV